MMSLSGPEILGPHNDVGEIVRSWSGPETPGFESLMVEKPSRRRGSQGAAGERRRRLKASSDPPLSPQTPTAESLSLQDSTATDPDTRLLRRKFLSLRATRHKTCKT